MSYTNLLQRDDTDDRTRRRTCEPTKKEVFDVLSNRRRQCVVHYLKRTGRSVAVSDLVDYVTAWETESPIDDLDPVARKRVYNALRQTHLPKLDDAGVIEYDADDNRVELTDVTSDVELYLERVPDDGLPWHVRYLGLSAVAIGLVGAGWFDLVPGSVPEFVLGLLVLVLFVSAAAVHALRARRNRIEANERFDVPAK